MIETSLTLEQRKALVFRIGVTLLALAAFRAGQWVPLPGLDLAALGQTSALNTFGTPRAMTSIMALGVIPLLTALILAEGILCLSRRIRQWAGTANGESTLWRGTILVALLLAVLQAYGVATALEAIPTLVFQPGTAFRIGVATSFAGATVLVVVLAGWITRYGIGHGLWVLLGAGYAEIFIQPLLLQLQMLSMGAIGLETLLANLALWFGFLAAATAVLTALCKAAPPLSTPQELVWSPLVAGLAVSVLLGAVLVLIWIVAPGSATVTERAAMDLHVPLLALAIAVVVLARRRTMLPSNMRVNVAAAVPAIAALVIFSAAGVFFPYAKTALLLAAVGVLILESNRPAPGPAAPPPLARA